MKAKLVKESLGSSYYRLPKNIIGNELYSAKNSLRSLYDTVSAGNDLDIQHLDNIIIKLNKVRESAKRFEDGESPTRDFE